jgi:predicted NBD/HSP70 family sugar kinase
MDQGSKSINISADEGVILQKIFRHGPINRADLAKEAGFSRSKVSGLVTDLLFRDILSETNRPGSCHGKWKDLDINQHLGYLVGIDIGTTSVDVSLADCSCSLMEHQFEASNVNDGPEIVLGQATNLLEEILQSQNVKKADILGIGVGIPGPVRFPSGEVIGGQFTPGWEGHKIQEILSKDFPGAVIMTENDANLMAVGSFNEGLAQNTDNFIFVKIGTGIGAGVFCGGQLYRGATSCAGHIGHTCVDLAGPVCRCGNKGCLEAKAGGLAIAEIAEAAAAEGKSKLLMRLKNENRGRLTAVQVGEAAARQDQIAQSIIIGSAALIGSVLAGVVNLHNPELIVLGGGVSKLGDLFLAEIRREVLKRTYSYTTIGLRIGISPINDTVGVIGATHFIRDWIFLMEGKPLSLAL